MNILFLCSLFLLKTSSADPASSVDVNHPANGTQVNETILSRRKRFIVFPDGSSFQLVFCTQTHGYLQVGDIVWFGQTAALAWELPTDPQIFYMFKDHKQELGPQRRKDDKKHIFYLDEDGRVIGKVPYRRKPIVNPAFAKRSVNNPETKDNVLIKSFNVKRMHATQKMASILRNLDEASVAFHRQGRKELFSKFETILSTFGYEGKECVLRMLCEAGKNRKEQGTFIEEIFRATFMLPSSIKHTASQTLEDLDIAHLHTEDCVKSFPACQIEDHHVKSE